MTFPAAHLLQAAIDAKRGELGVRTILAQMVDPGAVRPGTVERLRSARISAAEAVTAIVEAIRDLEAQEKARGKVVSLGEARRRRTGR